MSSLAELAREPEAGGGLGGNTRLTGGGFATYVRDGLRAYTVQKGESGVVVELSDAVPALRIVNVYRSVRRARAAGRELPAAGAR